MFQIQMKSKTNYNLLIVFLIVFIAFVPVSECYLQFKLVRIPHESKQIKQQPFNCPTSLKSLEEVDYKQICYDKDISYSFQIEHEGALYYFSADLTTPISWIKGKQCTLAESTKKCSLIEHNFAETVKQYTQAIKKRLKSHKISSQKRQKAQIQGSSNIIKGYLQKPQHLSFQIMDSNRLTRIVDILLLGFYILDQKDALQLESTKFINATQISPKLNYVSDGAISLRFDQNSENSFLNEIFQYTKAEEKIITLYLGENNHMALGELSLKFSEYGYGGINWVEITQDEYFGKLPNVKGIMIEDPEKQGHPKQITFTKPAVFTLSASYIGLHSTVVPLIQAKLSKQILGCQFESLGYLKCTYSKKSDRDKDVQKILTFDFNTAAISLSIKDLIIHEQGKSFILNIKQIFQNDYIILGQPVFKKYTLYLDYGQQRVGFAIRRQHFQKPFISVVSLVRFLVMIFTCGCLFILCSAPCRTICNRLFAKRIVPHRVGKQGIRLKQYSPIGQENPNDFQQISDKIKSITTSKETTQVDGHPDDEI